MQNASKDDDAIEAAFESFDADQNGRIARVEMVAFIRMLLT